MGKMNLNPEEFALAAATSQDSSLTLLELPSAAAAGNSDAGAWSQTTSEERLNTIQVKCDMVSNIVSDICGVVKELISAIGSFKVEQEKTKQAQADARARICVAEEQTEQVRIKESAATDRLREQCVTELKKAELELKGELAAIQRDKEALISDEKKFNDALSAIEKIAEHILYQNEKYMEKCQYSDEISKNNDKLIQLSIKIADLYIGASR